jgi:hypothetical protein
VVIVSCPLRVCTTTCAPVPRFLCSPPPPRTFVRCEPTACACVLCVFVAWGCGACPLCGQLWGLEEKWGFPYASLDHFLLYQRWLSQLLLEVRVWAKRRLDWRTLLEEVRSSPPLLLLFDRSHVNLDHHSMLLFYQAHCLPWWGMGHVEAIACRWLISPSHTHVL